MLKWLKSLTGRPSNPHLVVEGYRLPPIRNTDRIVTPLGSRITVVELCANVYYTMDDAGNPAIHRVALWQPDAAAKGVLATCNAFATHTGEAFRCLRLEPDEILWRAVEVELALPNSGLRRIMMARWRESNRGKFAQAIADALNNKCDSGQLAEKIDAARGVRGISFMYAKDDGSCRMRKVKVSSVSGNLLRGTDLEDGTVKTFRIDRISNAGACEK